MSATDDDRLTKLNEPDCESDEDCEVYFLKPVNEYNIVDKIKEANKELFAAIVDPKEVNESGTVIAEDANDAANATALTIRKVTFAFNLEDYEPVPEFELEKCDEATKQSVASTSNVSELPAKVGADLKFPPIDEEPPSEQETSDCERETLADDVQEQVAANGKQASIEECTQKPSRLALPEALVDDCTESGAEHETPTGGEHENSVDEICEEITVLSIDSCDRPLSANGRRIMKQATFDYDDHYQENDRDEEDSKSLTNLLASDYEESDEDDNLSIIVASYIPDDYERGSLTTPSDMERPVVNANRSCNNSQAHKMSLSKHFPLRRKPHVTDSPTDQATGSLRNRQRIHKPPPEVTELKLNYKTCCEFRHAVLEKLPKYTGYLSEYGLSREQRQRRADQAAKKQRFVLEQTLKVSEQDMRKMKDNERAFTTWLKNKMRFPINKTRNMFDVKLNIGRRCGGNSRSPTRLACSSRAQSHN